jgi:hypothetical protein
LIDLFELVDLIDLLDLVYLVDLLDLRIEVVDFDLMGQAVVKRNRCMHDGVVGTTLNSKRLDKRGKRK